MTATLDDLGPVDWIVVEFPGSKMTGEIAPILKDYVDRGLIRVLDLLILKKDDDGSLEAFELSDMDLSEVGELRAQTLRDNRDELVAAAAGLRADFDAGGQVLALGNGGSATDAMDAVADFRLPPRTTWPPRPAIDLCEDPAILTAIANDIGAEAIFARQVIAYGNAGDCLLALSTSGNSANVIAALAEARRRSLRTIALVGYDGGRVAAERLADHVIVTRSEHIPRIQEAQASAYHVLRELVEIAG